MLNIDQLDKQLTLYEYETGRDLFNLLRDRGFGVNKAAGIIYRAGYLDGRQESRNKCGREIGRLHSIINEMKNSPPEAIEEGGIVHE